MRVLVVEDDQALGLFLQKGLRLEGYEVDWVGDGETAINHAESFNPDLMVLDLGLPRRDGLEVLDRLQQVSKDMSVLVLTGRSGLEDRLASFNSGADDCLLKPFSFHELTARCRALARRRAAAPSNMMLKHRDLELNRVERRANRGGNPLDLTVKEFALLEYLLLHRGRTVSRAELLQEVWAMSPDAGTNVVDVYINYLRRKLASAADEKNVGSHGSLIETVRGEGYRLREQAAKPMAATHCTPEWRSTVPSQSLPNNVVTLTPSQSHVYQMALELAREQIHDLSQPATALLCHLELGRIMGTDEAMREAVSTGIAEAARLVAILQTLRDTVARGLATHEKGQR